ncbi:MAG TPA: hypothetical protein VMW79_10840 [Anaerolineae bacterium]|nr:hypothetical protein [Anaerolineae bacterium]
MTETEKMAKQIKTLLYLLGDPGGRELLDRMVAAQLGEVRKAVWMGGVKINCGSLVVTDEDVTRWDHLEGKEVTMYLVDEAA